MIAFETDSNILDYVRSKLSLPVTTVDACTDVISCKIEWGDKNYSRIQAAIQSYADSNPAKTVHLVLVTDSCDSFIIPPNVRVYRTSLLKSRRVANEYVLPYIWEGLSVPFEPLPITEKPIIGFCGQLNRPERHITVTKLTDDKRFTTNFIIRQSFWGGKPHDPVIVKAFEDNILSSHFTICHRGGGNFSMRFYQTLSAGRIPILLNTDMVLPFEDEIPWNDIIVMATTQEALIERIMYVWTNKNIVELQKQCRDIYDRYFRGTRYFDRVFSSTS